jgi:hypothetical protein
MNHQASRQITADSRDIQEYNEGKGTMQSAIIETSGNMTGEDFAARGGLIPAIPAGFGLADGGIEAASNGQQTPVAFTLALIDRLEDLLERETGGLKSYSITELKELNHRKSQCLLELMRASRSLDGQPQSRALVERLAALRNTVDRNQAALQIHVDAVKEIATIISDTLRDTESDGTYDERPAARG